MTDPPATDPAPDPAGTDPAPIPAGTDPAPDPATAYPAPIPAGTAPAPDPAGTDSAGGHWIPPVRQQLAVPIGPLEAFRVFTEEIGTWWPVDGQRSVHGPGGSVGFAGDVLVETSRDGLTAVWAEVLTSIPGALMRLNWHPGRESVAGTTVQVDFQEIQSATGDAATLVTLVHDGWESLVDPAGSRAEYDLGWTPVLADFGAATAAAAALAAVPEQVWLVLRHSAGPAAPSDGSIFAHPDFAAHAAFLTTMADRGVLVAAGPLLSGDRPGAEGMTVLRVPADEADRYETRCREEDLSVARGLFDVQVTRWNVVSTGAPVG